MAAATVVALMLAAIVVVTLPAAVFLQHASPALARARAMDQKRGTLMWAIACNHKLLWYIGLTCAAVLVVAASDAKTGWLRGSLGTFYGSLLLNILSAAPLALLSKARRWYCESQYESLEEAFASYPERLQRLYAHRDGMLSGKRAEYTNAIASVLSTDATESVYPSETDMKRRG